MRTLLTGKKSIILLASMNEYDYLEPAINSTPLCPGRENPKKFSVGAT